MAGISSGGTSVDQQTIKTNTSGQIEVAPNILNDLFDHELEIIELQANTGLTPLDHDSLISDTFSDSDGYLDSVASATATFDTNKYKRENAGLAVTLEQSNSSLAATTGKGGIRINPAVDLLVVSLTVQSGGSESKAYIYSDLPFSTLIQSGDIVGGVCTFSNPVLLEASHGSYYVVTDKDGVSRVPRYTTVHNYNYDASGLNANGSLNPVNQAATTSFLHLVQKITYAVDETKKTITLDLPTITGSVVATQLVINDPERETGDNITYDLTDGVTTDSDQESTIQNNSSLASNPTQVIINLEPKSTPATDGYPSVKTYALKVWKEI